MGFRIVLGLIILIAGYLTFNITSLYLAYQDLSDVPESQILGTQRGGVEIIAFLDYTDPLSRQIDSLTRAAIARDGASYYVPRAVFFGDGEAPSANYAYYAHLGALQNVFPAMHDLLLSMNGKTIDDAMIADIIVKTKMDTQDLPAPEAISAAMIATKTLYDKIGIRRTPTLIIGKNIFFSPENALPSVDDIQKLIARSRGDL